MLLSLVNGFLNLKQIENGALQLCMKFFDVNEVFESIIEVMSIEAKMKNIKLKYVKKPLLVGKKSTWILPLLEGDKLHL